MLSDADADLGTKSRKGHRILMSYQSVRTQLDPLVLLDPELSSGLPALPRLFSLINLPAGAFTALFRTASGVDPGLNDPQ